MPFCPKCRYEYNPEVSTCPDCNERLVTTLPAEEEQSEVIYEDWTQVARLTSPQYAEMLLEALQAKDIPIVIQSGSGHFGQIGQMGMSALAPIGGGYSVMIPLKFVPEADREATALLGEIWESARLINID
jgi:hypothetical protein